MRSTGRGHERRIALIGHRPQRAAALEGCRPSKSEMILQGLTLAARASYLRCWFRFDGLHIRSKSALAKALARLSQTRFLPSLAFFSFRSNVMERKEGLKDRKQKKILVTETGTLSSQLTRVVYHISVWASI